MGDDEFSEEDLKELERRIQKRHEEEARLSQVLTKKMLEKRIEAVHNSVAREKMLYRLYEQAESPELGSELLGGASIDAESLALLKKKRRPLEK